MTSLAEVHETTLKPRTSRALSTTHGGCGNAIVGFLFVEATGEKFFSSASSRAEAKSLVILSDIHSVLYMRDR